VRGSPRVGLVEAKPVRPVVQAALELALDARGRSGEGHLIQQTRQGILRVRRTFYRRQPTTRPIGFDGLGLHIIQTYVLTPIISQRIVQRKAPVRSRARPRLVAAPGRRAVVSLVVRLLLPRGDSEEQKQPRWHAFCDLGSLTRPALTRWCYDDLLFVHLTS